MVTRYFHLFIIFLLLFPVVCKAQSTQQVLVQEYKEKSKKTPLEGVSLSVQNAGSTISNAQGQLTLQFRTMKAGDAVQVRRVDLSGYEVFNQEAVNQWTISPQKTFNLVLCRSDRFKQLRDQYMRVSSQSYERQYKAEQARLAALRKENKLQEEAYQQQLTDLENDYYAQLDNLENYVDRFARIDLSELTSQEQHLVELVQEGKIDEAIQLYESSDYLSQYNAQVKDLQEISKAQERLAQVEAEKLSARDKIQAAIDRQVQTYQLAGGRENYSKIAALLKGVADADTTNLSALWQYVYFSLQQNMFEDTENYIHLYLRQNEDKTAIARANVALSQLYYSKFDYDQAEKYNLQAVSIAQECVAEDSVRFTPLLNDVQYMLHHFYTSTQQQEKNVSFSEALADRLEKYYAEDPQEHWDLFAMLNCERGFDCYILDNDVEKSESMILRSYQIVKQHEDNEMLNTIITYLNYIYYNTQQWQKMEPYLLEELAYIEEKYSKNPTGEMKYLFSSYINLTELYYNLDKLAESHQYLDKSLSLLSELTALYDESLLTEDKMNLYDAASQLYDKEGNIEQARSYASQCLESFDQLPEELKEGREIIIQRNKEILNK